MKVSETILCTNLCGRIAGMLVEVFDRPGAALSAAGVYVYLEPAAVPPNCNCASLTCTQSSTCTDCVEMKGHTSQLT